MSVRPPPRRELVWVLAAGRLIGAAGAMVAFTFFTVYLRRAFHLPLPAVGTVAGLLSAGAMAGTFAGGWAADRIGRRAALLLTLGCEAAALAGLALSHDVVFAALFGIILGAADGALWPTFGAAVADILPPRERQHGFAIMAAGVNAGAAIGPAAGGFILGAGFERLFLFAAVGVGLGLAALALWLPETHPAHVGRGRADPRPVATGPGGYGLVLHDRTVLAFMALLFPALLSMGLVITFFPLAAMSTPGVGPRLFGLLFALWGGVIAVLQLPVTRYVQNMRATTALALGYTAMALAFVPIALAPGPAGFTAGILLLAVSEILNAPPQGTLVANLAPAGARARYQSLIGLVWSTGGVVGPVLAGAVYGHVPAVWFWLGAGVLAFLPSPFFILWAGRMPRIRQAEDLALRWAEAPPPPVRPGGP